MGGEVKMKLQPREKKKLYMAKFFSFLKKIKNRERKNPPQILSLPRVTLSSISPKFSLFPQI